MSRSRASLFTLPPTALPQEHRPVVVLPAVDATVEKAQALVNNYVADQLEATGQERVLLAPLKRIKTEDDESKKGET